MQRYKHNNHSLQDQGYLWRCSQCQRTWLRKPRNQCTVSGAQHTLQANDRRFFCEKCECVWRSKPTARCPGIPVLAGARIFAVLYDEKLYHESILPALHIRIKPKASACAVTDHRRTSSLYSADCLQALPAPAFTNTDLDLRLQLIEHYAQACASVTQNQPEKHAVAENLLLVWGLTATEVQQIVNGRVVPITHWRHIVYYADASALRNDLVRYRVARRLLDANRLVDAR